MFTGSGQNEKTLFLEKRRITLPVTEFQITVDSEPSRAGIDPYNKLIDRAPNDNTAVVSRHD